MIGLQKKKEKEPVYEESDSYHMPSCGIEYGFESGLWRHSKGGWLLHEGRAQIRILDLCQGQWEIEMDDLEEGPNNQVFDGPASIRCGQIGGFFLLCHL